MGGGEGAEDLASMAAANICSSSHTAEVKVCDESCAMDEAPLTFPIVRISLTMIGSCMEKVAEGSQERLSLIFQCHTKTKTLKLWQQLSTVT